MAAYLVNKTLDGDSEIIKATKDVYARGKAKALLIKINKGKAERPACLKLGHANCSNSASKNTCAIENPEDIIARYLNPKH
ncbi:MAG: hypothetical protein Ct9H90mP20_1210 [Candidatus Neomarinimicrobiota bacterium]|nr:MAG: hypothetical protein Ct9H90mP20_1210 [Candidatus Neomarinimicrobiota bacterium]